MNLIKKCRYGLMIYNQKDIYQGKSFENYGEFSQSEVEIFKKVIKPGDTVVEAGACIGAHTVVFSRIVGPNGLVVAFEPERNNFYTLCGNIAINNLHNVYAFHQAVGLEMGTIRIPEINYEETQNFG